MGLSGRKVKQRIPEDPRNLSWADNAAKFGQTYLSKFGWDASQGLGAAGEGRTSAIKVDQKLDMLGIGMQHQRDANGIAWRQNRDFENLLRRLNGGASDEGPFKRAEHDGEVDTEVVKRDDESGGEEQEGTAKKDKKKKRKAAEDAGDKKEKKKRKSEKGSDASSSATPAKEPTPPPTIAAPAPIRAPPRAHRARNMASKRMASMNPAALSEILGIPSSSLPSTPVAATVAPSPAPEVDDGLHKQTTAPQSVADYFRAKLLAKSRPASSASSRTEDTDSDAPRLGLGASMSRSDEDEPSRMGLGARPTFAAMFASAETVRVDERAEMVIVEEVDVAVVASENEKSEQKRAKAERRKAKEERRRLRSEAKGKGKASKELETEAEKTVDVDVERPKKSKKMRADAEEGGGVHDTENADAPKERKRKKRE